MLKLRFKLSYTGSSLSTRGPASLHSGEYHPYHGSAIHGLRINECSYYRGPCLMHVAAKDLMSPSSKDSSQRDISFDQSSFRPGGQSKWIWLTVLRNSFRRSTTMCALPYHLQLHYHLESWWSHVNLKRVQVRTNIHVSTVAYADSTVPLGSAYMGDIRPA